MKTERNYCELLSAPLSLALCVFGVAVSAQTIPGQAETNVVLYHETLEKRFRAGDTDIPLLSVDSLKGPLYSGRIQKNGRVTTHGSNGLSNWTDWNRPALSATNLHTLDETLSKLPPSAQGSIPMARQIHVSALRTNGCFHGIYDLDNLPAEVRKVLAIIGPPFSTMVPPPRRPSAGSESPLPANQAPQRPANVVK